MPFPCSSGCCAICSCIGTGTGSGAGQIPFALNINITGVADLSTPCGCAALNGNYCLASQQPRGGLFMEFCVGPSPGVLEPYINQSQCAWNCIIAANIDYILPCDNGGFIDLGVAIVKGTDGTWAAIVHASINGLSGTSNLIWIHIYESEPDCSALNSLVINGGFTYLCNSGALEDCDISSSTVTLSVGTCTNDVIDASAGFTLPFHPCTDSGGECTGFLFGCDQSCSSCTSMTVELNNFAVAGTPVDWDTLLGCTDGPHMHPQTVADVVAWINSTTFVLGFCGGGAVAGESCTWGADVDYCTETSATACGAFTGANSGDVEVSLRARLIPPCTMYDFEPPDGCTTPVPNPTTTPTWTWRFFLEVCIDFHSSISGVHHFSYTVFELDKAYPYCSDSNHTIINSVFVSDCFVEGGGSGSDTAIFDGSAANADCGCIQ